MGCFFALSIIGGGLVYAVFIGYPSPLRNYGKWFAIGWVICGIIGAFYTLLVINRFNLKKEGTFNILMIFVGSVIIGPLSGLFYLLDNVHKFRPLRSRQEMRAQKARWQAEQARLQDQDTLVQEAAQQGVASQQTEEKKRHYYAILRPRIGQTVHIESHDGYFDGNLMDVNSDNAVFDSDLKHQPTLVPLESITFVQ